MGEAPQPGLITHYIPQFLLRQFRAETLYELDRQSGAIQARNVRRAGQQVDLYPEHLERGLFQRIDNAAARIFREKLYGHERIILTDEERQALAEWLLIFAVRIPQRLTTCEQIVERWEANPQNALTVLDEDIDLVIGTLRNENREQYAVAVAELGEDGFKAVLHELMRREILAGRHPRADSRRLFEQLHTSGRHHDYTSRLYVLKWTWLRTNGEFVIGDNPLCRWDARRSAYNVGLERSGLEITIPLTSKVTLWMHRNYRHADTAVCNAARTRQLNRRQIVSAVRYVYGPSCEALGG